jgi:site-specific DNA recombinase
MSKASQQRRLVAAASSGVAVAYLRVSTREQAERDGEVEGYSLPAQRDACLRKADALGTPIVEEFMDKGESGRTVNRPGLQRMLDYLQSNPVQYVIVHKVDRLARSRAHDVAINMAIQQSGARLISVTESIDESPSGILLHGIMSSIAEFYSQNLATEVLKGQTKKAESGGVNGRVVTGYLNVMRETSAGVVRTVEVDPVRGPLMRWAFEAYATGNYSVRMLLDELTERGLTTAPMKTRPGKPLVKSHFLRLLRHPYYKGIVRFNGVESQGRHEPLVSVDLWEHVQALLDSQGYAGEKRRDHHHYLKGTVFCGSCGSRLLVTRTVNRHRTVYWYFICSGRKTKRTTCTQPALPIDRVEELVELQYRTVELRAGDRVRIRELISADMGARTDALVAEQRHFKTRRTQLLDERQKLLQAHYAGAIPLELLKSEQARITQALDHAETNLATADRRLEVALANLDAVLALLGDCHRAYLLAAEDVRRMFNQAFFEAIYISDDDVKPRLTSPVDLLLRTPGTGAGQRDDSREAWRETSGRMIELIRAQKEPAAAFATTGSHMNYMVELRGFEPLTFSLRTRRATNCATAPSAWETLAPGFGSDRIGPPERQETRRPSSFSRAWRA